VIFLWDGVGVGRGGKENAFSRLEVSETTPENGRFGHQKTHDV
jgi:hypothetical protein